MILHFIYAFKRHTNGAQCIQLFTCLKWMFTLFVFNILCSMLVVCFFRCTFDLWEEKRAKMHWNERHNMHKIVQITMQRNEKNGNVKVAERRIAVDVFLINIQQHYYMLWLQKAFFVPFALPESHMVFTIFFEKWFAKTQMSKIQRLTFGSQSVS